MSAATWSADLDDDHWSVHAECRDVDPELFFFGGESAAYAYQIEEARAVCGGCPVARECLNYAIRARADFGMWGGTTPEERRRLGRQVVPVDITRHTRRAILLGR
ncbi:WhiB family transcriptional regulator [Oryzobacter terrae]|uniref:WhiB family transcriptional regulator n=1 Tax=Oryzobacter terrae TaxID=1620385 RepID=UPI00366E1AED